MEQTPLTLARIRGWVEGFVMWSFLAGVPMFVGYRCRHEMWVAVMLFIDIPVVLFGVLSSVRARDGERLFNSVTIVGVTTWIFVIIVKPVLWAVSALHRLLTP